MDEVQSYLDQVPGTVVVIMDSCLPGQYITTKSLSPAKKLAAARAYGSAWISKFSGSKATNFTAKALTPSTVKSKYKILVAAEPLEYSFGADDSVPDPADPTKTINICFGWFTKWAAAGIGQVANITSGSSTKGNLEADENSDRVVSLDELYDYVPTNLPNDQDYAWWDAISQQHAQVWPANDNFPVVNRAS